MSDIIGNALQTIQGVPMSEGGGGGGLSSVLGSIGGMMVGGPAGGMIGGQLGGMVEPTGSGGGSDLPVTTTVTPTATLHGGAMSTTFGGLGSNQSLLIIAAIAAVIFIFGRKK